MFQFLITFLIDLYRVIFALKPVFFHEISPRITLLTNTIHTKPAPQVSNEITVFGIETAFTTISPSTHKRFIQNVTSLLKKSNNESARSSLAANARSIAQDFINESSTKYDTESMNLSHLVQILTFRTILQIFYPHVVRSFNEDGRFQSTTDVLLVCSKISSLWSLSKCPWELFAAKYLPSRWSTIMRDRAILLGTLESQFPWYRTYLPQRNPLNVLIPAHLALCELIINCFVEIKSRGSESWEGLFKEFVKSPGEEAWMERDEEGVSVEMTVVETLRLYPTTKEIYVQRPDGGMDVLDIETLHRTGDVWGEDSDEFKPDRWVGGTLDVIEMGYFIPIVRKGAGATDGNEVCREKEEEGELNEGETGVPKLIALFVGVLLEALEGWELDDNSVEEGGGKCGEAFGSEVYVYEGLRLKRKDS